MERSLPHVLTRHTSGVLWRSLGGFAVIMMAAVVAVSWWSVRQTLERTADVVESLLGLYADPTGEPTTVAPAMLVDQLAGVGARFFITRRMTDGNAQRRAYFLTPQMPAREIAGISPNADNEEIAGALRAGLAGRQLNFAILHRARGSFDIFVALDRTPYLFAVGGLLVATVVLLPISVLVARRATRQLVQDSLAPVEQLRAEIAAITPAALQERVTTPTGWRETTEIADTVNGLIDQVDQAHRALAAFTADASHELRTPLTFVRAQAQWLLDRPRSAQDMREAVALMSDEAERMHRLVEQLLLLARGDNNDLETPESHVDVAAIVHEVAEVTTGLVAQRPIAVVTDIKEPLQVRGDAGQLRQILLNLASNAARYTDAGTIALRGRQVSTGIELDVADTGIGIAPAHVPRLFERFFRAESSRSRASGGAGLGLAIVRMLVDHHGGEITVSSEAGQGSCFTVRIPTA
ncbi:sensor histidine kinase [Gemmatimonas phototrophica]|uniref:sensor histidine kinase n=1 Tax=Gemmatimonas phototrophica TaxID=1379270 RepID=UPI0009ED07B7|nr:ATP-binding protein [Gemmatimonas phototrophica]